MKLIVPRRPWRFSSRIALPVSVAAAAIVVLTVSGMVWATRQGDHVSVRRQIRMAELAITSEVDAMPHDQQVVAIWDDAVKHVANGPNFDWLNENVGTWMYSLFGHERAYVLNEWDEPVYAMADGIQVPESRFEVSRAALQVLIDQVRGRLRYANHRHDRQPRIEAVRTARIVDRAIYSSHFLQVENRPAVASVMKIVPDTEHLRQKPGTEPLLVNIRFLDGSFLNELAERNLIEGARYSATGERRPGEEAFPLVTEFGQPIGSINWRPELPGTQILSTLAPVFFVSAFSIILVMMFLLRSLARALGDHTLALEEARHASEAKSQFLASVSHEIRTPLNSVMGFTDQLLDREDLPGDARRSLDLIKLSSRALLTVINDVLDFSKIEAGAIELHPHPFSPAALVGNCISIVRDLAVKKGLRMEAQVDDSLPEPLLGDEPRLRQILLNFLNNAIKFTPSGEIVLTLRREETTPQGERLRFAVTDTGIGIPLDKQQELFKRFRQIDGSATRQFGGTGLGLAISKGLVIQMGGEVGVTSAPGQGSTFWFVVTLPWAEETPSVEADAAQAEKAHRSAYILLAEDVAVNQEIAVVVLEAMGHRVDVVSDGAEAVAAVRDGRYDLVLMDVQMPVMDGISATRRIRALPGPESRIPIIAMTANVYAEQVASFRQAGMQDHVGKPFQRGELMAAINRWLPAE